MPREGVPEHQPTAVYPDELGILQRWKREELHDESLPISPISPALYGRNMILAFSEDRKENEI